MRDRVRSTHKVRPARDVIRQTADTDDQADDGSVASRLTGDERGKAHNALFTPLHVHVLLPTSCAAVLQERVASGDHEEAQAAVLALQPQFKHRTRQGHADGCLVVLVVWW